MVKPESNVISNVWIYEYKPSLINQITSEKRLCRVSSSIKG